MKAVRVMELVGESGSSWQEAAQNAVEEAAQNLSTITGVEVYNMTAAVEGGRIVEYKANVKVAYTEGK